MKLAIVTPLPPQHTGIADYVSDLLGSLIEKNSFDITVISNADINNIHNYKVYSYKDFSEEEYYDFDLILYQLGNNYVFHGYMLRLVKKFGGVIHLHDLVLHHLFAEMLWANNKTDEYFNLIKNNYGVEKLNYIKEKILKNNYIWDSDEVINFPLFEEFIKFCNGCIVHSEFTKNKIKKLFPTLNVSKISQLYNMNYEKEKKTISKQIRFGIFGGVDPQKKVDIVLKVLSSIKLKTEVDYHLFIIGGINPSCEYILDLPKKYGIQRYVTITGRAEEKEFMNYFRNTDVLIALRNPTMGETSAVVMRAMQLGIPCIVNDIGWYSELPDHIIKISVDKVEVELKDKILRILTDEIFFDFLNNEALKYGKEELNFDKSIEEYSNVIKLEYENKLNKIIYQQLGTTMKDLNIINEPFAYTPTVNKLIDLFNR